MFTQRPTTYWKIERSDGRGFGRQQLLANSIENFKPFWILNWVSIARVVACFPQASSELQAGCCPQRLQQTRKHPVFVLASQTLPSRAWELPQELGSWLCPLNLLLPAFREIARWPAGDQTWTQTWTLPPNQRVEKVWSPPKSQHKLCGVWILLSLLLVPNWSQVK